MHYLACVVSVLFLYAAIHALFGLHGKRTVSVCSHSCTASYQLTERRSLVQAHNKC